MLVENILKSKLSKHATLKNEDLVKDLIANSLVTATKTEDQTVKNIESRLIASKAITTETANTLSAFQSIILGNSEKIEKKKAEEFKKKQIQEKKKRKAEEEIKKPTIKKAKKTDVSSEFVDTLGDMTDDENEDENFKKIYEGEKKPNRQGQRQRRK